MNILKIALDWILRSSADRDKFSLTLKAGIPFLVIFLGWAGLNSSVVEPLLGPAVDSLANLVAVGAQFVTGAIAFYGLMRKIWLTAKK